MFYTTYKGGNLMIGERIKILRTERNLTQAALAHALGIAKTEV